MWRARCFQPACRARDHVRDFPDVDRAQAWATGHAENHKRGGHTVAVWSVVDGKSTRAHMLRYADPVKLAETWIWWGWACLHCPLERTGQPAWHEGHLDRRSVLAGWRDHECGGTA